MNKTGSKCQKGTCSIFQPPRVLNKITDILGNVKEYRVEGTVTEKSGKVKHPRT